MRFFTPFHFGQNDGIIHVCQVCDLMCAGGGFPVEHDGSIFEGMTYRDFSRFSYVQMSWTVSGNMSRFREGG